MFKVLDDKTTKLMLDLSKENLGDLTDLQSRLKDADINALFDLCREHELLGVVVSHIIKHQLIELDESILTEYRAEKERLTFLKEKASEVASLMYENGIPLVVLKNGGIMSDMIDDTAKCPMEDIDSLVKKEDFYKAHQILVENGFVFKFRSEFEKEKLDEAFRDGSTEYYFTMPDGNKMWFELAWRAIAGRWIRLDKEPNVNDLFERVYFAKDTKVGILSPEDNLLQVCVHTAKHSYVRSPGLRLHLDVERIVSHKEIDWKLFVEKVKNASVKTSTYFSLLIPKNLFGTNIPEWVLEELKPKKSKERKIRKLLAKVGLLHPRQRKFSKIQFLRFQTSLYDSRKDMWKVIYPSFAWYKEKYGVKCKLFVPIYMFKRILDLMGIRKKK